MPATSQQIQQQEQPGAAPLNRDIELFLGGSECLEIDFEFGMAELNKYLQDLQMLSIGVKYKDLGISERRKGKESRVLFDISSAQQGGTYSFASWRDLYFKKEIPENSIALLSLSGVMRSESGLSSPGVDSMIEDLRNAYSHSNVSGIIIETNSGGGESLAGTMLKSAIQERNKPVVGFGHLAASAAYRALSGSDEIIGSSPSSEFGSIGTMISLNSKVLNKYRELYADFYGSGAPGKNADFRQALAGNFSGIQKRVDELTAKFQKEIRSDRQLRGDSAMISQTLDGSVFDATESKRRGLVDGIGNMQYAVKRVRALSKLY